MNFLKCILCLVTLFGGLQVSAQQNLRIKTGASIANARAINTQQIRFYDWVAGYSYVNVARFYAGVSTDIKVGKSFTIEPEVAYLGMGYLYSKESTEGQRLNYLSIPVSFNYKANDQLSVFVGPYASYAFGELPNNFKKFDMGAQLGSEFLIYKGFGIGLRYFLGLANIYARVSNSDIGPYELYNRSFQVYAVYQLSFEKKTTY